MHLSMCYAEMINLVFLRGEEGVCVCGGGRGILYCIYIIIWLSLLLLRMHGQDSLSLNYYLLASLTSLTRLIHDLELDGNHAHNSDCSA